MKLKTLRQILNILEQNGMGESEIWNPSDCVGLVGFDAAEQLSDTVLEELTTLGVVGYDTKNKRFEYDAGEDLMVLLPNSEEYWRKYP